MKMISSRGWDIFDSFCNEIAGQSDVSDLNETIELQLMITLIKMKDHDPDLLVFLGMVSVIFATFWLIAVQKP